VTVGAETTGQYGPSSVHVGRRSTATVRQPILAILLLLCGFTAVQRFTLDPANSLICVLPYSLFLFYLVQQNFRTALSCLILSLVFSVDNGGGAYTETPAPLRYVIYLSGIGMMICLSRRQIHEKALLLAAFLVSGLIIGTLLSISDAAAVFDSATLRRDVQALFILSIFLFVRGDVRLDPFVLFAGGVGYVAGEAVNAVLFYDFGSFDYLSYDSLKAFAVFPALYAITYRHSHMAQLALMVITFLLISLYGSRMITLSAIGLVSVALVISSIRAGKWKIYLAAATIFIMLANVDVVALLKSEPLVRVKALSFIAVIFESFDSSEIMQMFMTLDRVRFAEHQLFFSRHPLELIFGSGLGSGVVDTQGLLGFLAYEQTAFSTEEIRTSIYFNLHDFWIDYGLRFGLLPVVYLIYILSIREMWRGRPWIGVLFGILLLNTTFATSGLVLTSMIVRFFPRERVG
jgi:hypothetical protein